MRRLFINKWGLLLVYGLLVSGLAVKFGLSSVPAIIGVMVGVVILFNTEIALYVFILATQVLIFFAISLETFILLVVSWLLYVFRNRTRFFASAQSKVLIILTVWIIFNTGILSNDGLVQTLRNMFKLFVPITLFFAVITVIKSRRYLMRFIKFLLIIGAIISIIGLLQLFLQTPLFSYLKTDPTSPMQRAAGSIGDPVAYGTQVTFLLMLCFSALLGQPQGKYKIFLFFIMIALIFALLTSLNRSSILGLVMFVMVMLFLNRKASIKLIIFVAIVLILLSLTNFYDPFIKQIESIWITVPTPSEHFAVRLEAMTAGLKVIRDNPHILIFGGGVNSFDTLINPYVFSFGSKTYANTNAFIVFLIELGIAGFIIVLIIFWLTLRELSVLQKEFKKTEDHSMLYLSQGLFASFIALLLISLVNEIWFMHFFWINMALAVVIRNIFGKNGKNII